MPGWVPDDLNRCVFNARQGEDLLLGVAGDGGSHTTPRSCEGHLHEDLFGAAGEKLDPHVIDQSQIDDVDRDFGIITAAEGFPDRFLVRVPVTGAVDTSAEGVIPKASASLGPMRNRPPMAWTV